MSKSIKCPLCHSEIEQQITTYSSGETDLSGNEIIVPDVKINHCANLNCDHTWLSSAEEEKIDLYILQRSRKFLEPIHVGMIRKSLGFATKTAAANFLTLNSKAFTKWENGYTEPNSANDLLMRLAAFSEINFNFIKDLHAKKFAFDPIDYEMICKSTGQEWKYNSIHVNSISAKVGFNNSLFTDNKILYAHSPVTVNPQAPQFNSDDSYDEVA